MTAQPFYIICIDLNKTRITECFRVLLDITETTDVWELVEKAWNTVVKLGKYDQTDVKVFKMLETPGAERFTKTSLLKIQLAGIDPGTMNGDLANQRLQCYAKIQDNGPWKGGGVNFLFQVGEPISIYDIKCSEKCRKRKRALNKSSDNTGYDDWKHDLSRPPSVRTLATHPPTAELMGFAPIDGTIIRREQTVQALYKRLEHYKFIVVRGTPGSGKSTLAELLTLHIQKEEIMLPSQEKVLPVQIIQMGVWDKRKKPQWLPELTSRGYNHVSGNPPCVIIWDEAQTTYWDLHLWNGFFKSIDSTSPHRVILFVSYGSPHRHLFEEPSEATSTLPKYLPATPDIVEKYNRVELRPIDHGDGQPAVGLLLTRDEYRKFVSTKHPNAHFDEEFLDFVEEATAGHPGAVEAFLNVVVNHQSFLKNEMPEYTGEMFKALVSWEEFWGKVKCNPFMRGLPDMRDLQHPEVARVLRTILVDKEITAVQPRVEGGLSLCFKQGWLHAAPHSEDDVSPIKYMFASPLHRLWVEAKLGIARETRIREKSLLEFVIQVIKRFSQRTLYAQKIIENADPEVEEPVHIHRHPEAQYQNEFYRCCFLHTGSTLATFPEFGGANGKIDFYIPSKCWGVEVLRDGNRLEEHTSRFLPSENYSKLSFDDWIILDFRTAELQQARSDMKHLYHVVFSDKYQEARIVEACTLNEITRFALST